MNLVGTPEPRRLEMRNRAVADYSIASFRLDLVLM